MFLFFDQFAKIYRQVADRAVFRIYASVYAPALLGLLLASCQGSNLGSSLEGAIAPSSTPTSETVTTESPLSTIATPSPTPPAISQINQTNQINRALITDLAQQALTKTAANSFNLSSKSTSKSSLNSLLSSQFYIDLDKFTASTPSANQAIAPAIAKFQDLDQAPAALRTWIDELGQLGTISAKTGQNFQPNIPVARREYARWLLETNNRLYQNQPSRQIRLAQPSDRPSFTDIPPSHPDFLIIQGLANAGLISTGDRFRPNDQLSREEMIQWKIPLDLRQPLPSANLNSINQSWGFQDSDRIGEDAQRAIFADAQLRDLSNIRRSFGFTTLLQPQKPVTRAEAAASLWYFGTATDGISVTKALQSQQK